MAIETEPSLPLIRPEWPAPSGVHACMSTRVGGVSRGSFASLNLGATSDDDAEAVRRNRARLRRAAALPAEPAWLQQVHGRHIVCLDSFEAGQAPPQADASWTAGDAVCAVLAADCLPVLLARRDGAAVAAVHAGWRGLAAGVVEAALAAIPGRPEQWQAWLGARIGPDHFLVHGDVRQAFDARDDATAFSDAGDGRWRADLGRLAALRLARAGVPVYDSGLCTASDPERFFSHRREQPCGRMAAVIFRGFDG